MVLEYGSHTILSFSLLSVYLCLIRRTFSVSPYVPFPPFYPRALFPPHTFYSWDRLSDAGADRCRPPRRYSGRERLDGCWDPTGSLRTWLRPPRVASLSRYSLVVLELILGWTLSPKVIVTLCLTQCTLWKISIFLRIGWIHVPV